jgi:hypothetical protein
MIKHTPGELVGLVLTILAAGFILGWAVGSARADASFWNDRRIVSCCSEADAVYADEWSVRDGKLYATVTGGGPRSHPWAPIGRTYEIAPERHVDIGGNPTGHGLLFLRQHDLSALCFIPGAGI